MRIIDYGNKEYVAILQLFAMMNPSEFSAHLEPMRENWPAHMDLWADHKTNAHWERLADITECIMGALRAEEWFMPL